MVNQTDILRQFALLTQTILQMNQTINKLRADLDAFRQESAKRDYFSQVYHHATFSVYANGDYITHNAIQIYHSAWMEEIIVSGTHVPSSRLRIT
jgi:hypothetical protein